MNQHSDTYSTTDLALAAALSLTGSSLLELERRDGGRTSFIFARNSKLDRTIDDYWNGALRVEPRGYFDAIRQLKARLYSEA